MVKKYNLYLDFLKFDIVLAPKIKNDLEES